MGIAISTDKSRTPNEDNVLNSIVAVAGWSLGLTTFVIATTPGDEHGRLQKYGYICFFASFFLFFVALGAGAWRVMRTKYLMLHKAGAYDDNGQIYFATQKRLEDFKEDAGTDLDAADACLMNGIDEGKRTHSNVIADRHDLHYVYEIHAEIYGLWTQGLSMLLSVLLMLGWLMFFMGMTFYFEASSLNRPQKNFAYILVAAILIATPISLRLIRNAQFQKYREIRGKMYEVGPRTFNIEYFGEELYPDEQAVKLEAWRKADEQADMLEAAERSPST